MNRKGFTLIELMIVIAIIAIIAAIAIPSLLQARRAANEGNAAATLKQFTSHQAAFKQNDADGNGFKDYWTADIAGFYALEDARGTAIKMIDVALAKADMAPAVTSSGNYQIRGVNKGSPPADGYGGTTPAVARTGYYYRVMTTDENGNAYQVDTDGDGNAYHNLSKYAIIATPASYGRDGVRIFIVNEEGVVYGVDNGKDTNEDYGALVLTWPASDPTSATVSNGNYWSTTSQ